MLHGSGTGRGGLVSLEVSRDDVGRSVLSRHLESRVGGEGEVGGSRGKDLRGSLVINPVRWKTDCFRQWSPIFLELIWSLILSLRLPPDPVRGPGPGDLFVSAVLTARTDHRDSSVPSRLSSVQYRDGGSSTRLVSWSTVRGVPGPELPISPLFAPDPPVTGPRQSGSQPRIPDPVASLDENLLR